MVCAPNAFKGSLTAAEAAAAMARGAEAAGATALALAVADGGDGTLDVLLGAAASPRVERIAVPGPLGDPVTARLGWLDAKTAVVELAEASGLRRLGSAPPGPRAALQATSRGTGALLLAALDGGARRILVGIGGSASSDGGAGLLDALGGRLLDAAGALLGDGGGALRRLARIDTGDLDPRLRQVEIEIAVDVSAPLLGPAGAAAVFGPQKGAGAAEVVVLESGLARLAGVAERDLGVDPRLRDLPGAGAAGGCGWALAAVCGARLVPGAALVCGAVGLDAAIAGAALVLTGEGRLDAQTAAGKAPAEVARRAAAAGVRCAVVAGSVAPGAGAGYADTVAVGDGLALSEAMARAAELVEAGAAGLVARLLAP